ncbi:MAG: Holliday junction resolvase RuvX [Lentimicrobiaceae bacterium]|nr:Holliday junction resolvase RuvX [Lentimicrobiaceae bacterium]
MGRILSIDYGQKRVGFAVTDELQICAHALETVHVADAFVFLKNYILKENVETIVVGEPKTMNNTNSDAARFIEPFVNRLRKEMKDINIVRFDERFTSRMAFQTLLDAGVNRKTRANKALLDKISATIILQSYLQHKELTIKN